MATERWLIDTDNGLGGPDGDVDDGFALAALFLADLPLAGVASVFGNTSESWAWTNTRDQALAWSWTGPLVRGAPGPGPGPSEAAHHFAGQFPLGVRVLSLGPLTNVAQALRQTSARPKEIVCVGGNASSWGSWPPYWPFEFNLTHDPWATQTVWASEVPLTLVPLDVCGRLKRDWHQIAGLRGWRGKWITERAHRWWKRARWRGQKRVPVWDLVAALYVISPSSFALKQDRVQVRPNGGVTWGRGDREVRWICDFDPEELWERFETLLGG